MKELYDTNERFRAYVNAYCFKADIQVEEALQHNIVREVGASYYKGNKKRGDSNECTKILVGCQGAQ